MAFEGQAFNSGRTWDVTVPRSLRLHVRTLRLERVRGSFVGVGLRGCVDSRGANARWGCPAGWGCVAWEMPGAQAWGPCTETTRPWCSACAPPHRWGRTSLATISLSASQPTQSPAQAIQQPPVGWDWIGIWLPKPMITASERGTPDPAGPRVGDPILLLPVSHSGSEGGGPAWL